MSDNLKIYNAVATVPEGAKKQIAGGKIKGFTDINPMWRIKMLTEQFGPVGIGWYYEITSQRLEPYEDEIAAFVDINLYVKINEDCDWSKPIVGVGGSKFVTKNKNGAEMSDECFKMALTDAISVACKALGFGADVYWANGRSKYNQEPEEPPAEPITDKQKSQIKEMLKQVAAAYGTTPVNVCTVMEKDIGAAVNGMSAKQGIKAMRYLSQCLQNATGKAS
ncbi:MAG: hypothetical protein J1G06_08580 [Oscillospiraceae bacterium]|nr:hypothetical protein [Oscillospiraceae bacterium]